MAKDTSWCAKTYRFLMYLKRFGERKRNVLKTCFGMEFNQFITAILVTSNEIRDQNAYVMSEYAFMQRYGTRLHFLKNSREMADHFGHAAELHGEMIFIHNFPDILEDFRNIYPTEKPVLLLYSYLIPCYGLPLKYSCAHELAEFALRYRQELQSIYVSYTYIYHVDEYRNTWLSHDVIRKRQDTIRRSDLKVIPPLSTDNHIPTVHSSTHLYDVYPVYPIASLRQYNMEYILSCFETICDDDVVSDIPNDSFHYELEELFYNRLLSQKTHVTLRLTGNKPNSQFSESRNCYSQTVTDLGAQVSPTNVACVRRHRYNFVSNGKISLCDSCRNEVGIIQRKIKEFYQRHPDEERIVVVLKRDMLCCCVISGLRKN